MPEERFCPHCGRANPVAMPRCINCGQRMGGGAGGTVLLAEKPEEETIHAPWWQSTPGSAIPPPPQVREEAARAEVARREAERIAAEQHQYEERLRHQAEDARARVQHHSAPAAGTGTKLANCWRCGSPMGESGATFSFCLRCGADSREDPRFAASTVAQEQQRQQQAMHPQVRVRIHGTQQAPLQNTANPFFVALLSFFFPGIGQMMNGQRGKGILLLLAWFVFSFAVPIIPGFLGIAGRVLAAMDAYRIAERRRAGKAVREEEWDLG